MITRILSWSAMFVLLLAVFLRFSPGYQVLLQFLVCTAAIWIAWEAYRRGQYLWVIAFGVIAVLFNPIQPIEFSNGNLIWLNAICIGTFGISLAVLKPKPALTDAWVSKLS